MYNFNNNNKNISTAPLNLATSHDRIGRGYSDQLKFKHRKPLLNTTFVGE